VGWGVFNIVEGVIDHHLLGIHHVHDGPDWLWWGPRVLAFGAVLLVAGWLTRGVGERSMVDGQRS